MAVELNTVYVPFNLFKFDVIVLNNVLASEADVLVPISVGETTAQFTSSSFYSKNLLVFLTLSIK